MMLFGKKPGKKKPTEVNAKKAGWEEVSANRAAKENAKSAEAAKKEAAARALLKDLGDLARRRKAEELAKETPTNTRRERTAHQRKRPLEIRVVGSKQFLNEAEREIVFKIARKLPVDIREVREMLQHRPKEARERWPEFFW